MAGVELGKPTYISEWESYPVNYIDYKSTMETSGSVATPISPGEIEITLTVQIAYTIED
jgi:uncharacterized protein YggE